MKQPIHRKRLIVKSRKETNNSLLRKIKTMEGVRTVVVCITMGVQILIFLHLYSIL